MAPQPQRPRTFALDAIESTQWSDEAAVDIDVEEMERTLCSAYRIFTGKRSKWVVLRLSPETS